ncbi:MAG: hypothetical protein ABIF85_05220 [Nanoarchaeota archaeon]|nr:hypothetical protein [Nanoarchaeota archaeon]MBU4300752.1 hypothetical protein [Nanoarchaeota archaeon]MBU4452380.1 hypothetical protein [Nanoarchaeota archaeon]MCG2723346.1 hypothetical protein [archaeon]
MIERNQVIALIGMISFGAAAIYLFQLSGLNDVFLESILSKTIDSTMTQAPLLNTIPLVAGIFALALSFAFVGIYALITQKIDWIIVIASMIMIPLSLMFIGSSLTGAVFGAGLFLSAIIMQYCPIDDAKAYKELKPARIIRGAVGTSILLTSVLIGLSVYITVSGDASYSEEGVNNVVDTMLKMTIDEETRASVEEVPGGMDMLKNQMQSSEVVFMIKTYYAQFSAITAFTIIQVIGIILAPIAGIFAWLMWKMNDEGRAESNNR